MTEPAKAQGKGGQDDLAILFPEQSATIDGVPVTIREYTFEQTLRLHAAISPITEGMASIALDGQLADLEAVAMVFANHPDETLRLIAESCGQPVEWVRNLTGRQGQDLRLLWWSVNAHFFGHRVRERIMTLQLRKSAGATSSTPSRDPATTRSSSEPTQSAS